jgi:ligand-binding sensor domain-containing protein
MMKNLYNFLYGCFMLLAVTTLFGQGSQWVRYTTANSGLPSDTVIALKFDHSGNLWIGYYGGSTTPNGVAKFNGTAWTSYSDNVNQDAAIDFAFNNGVVWMALDGYGLMKYDGSTWQLFTSDNSSLSDNSMNCVTADNAGNIWIGTVSALNKLKPDNTWSTYTSEQSFTHFPSDEVFFVVKDSTDKLWLSFGGWGIMKFDVATASGVMFNTDLLPDIPSDNVSCVAFDQTGALWAGTSYAGVWKLVINGTDTTVTAYSTNTDPNFINDNIHDIAVDKCGHVWIATDGGLSMYDGNTWQIFNTGTSPIPENVVRKLAVDAAGHIWITTDTAGLVEYKPLPEITYPYYPTNTGNVTADTVTCFWSWGCPGISRYSFEYADNLEFTNATVDTMLTTFTTGNPGKHLAGLVNGKTYYWRVKAENDAGYGPYSATQQFTVNVTAVSENHSGIANSFELQQNYPNPFSDQTVIRFSIPQRENISLKVYDVLGNEITTLVQSTMERGAYSVPVDATSLAGLHSGLYIYRLQAGDVQLEHTMQVLR